MLYILISLSPVHSFVLITHLDSPGNPNTLPKAMKPVVKPKMSDVGLSPKPGTSGVPPIAGRNPFPLPAPPVTEAPKPKPKPALAPKPKQPCETEEKSTMKVLPPIPPVKSRIKEQGGKF